MRYGKVDREHAIQRAKRAAERRGAGIGMHDANHLGGELSAGALVVRTTPSLDLMRDTIDRWSR